ncbi:LacI family DNA-binding transcriptional regulator [Oscillospiraceae bacterium MB08-C2-2]|nr:LacI family DNA-binding transcriptional regulator [Oscillospiraceae bacterium MB08-C2-2]
MELKNKEIAQMLNISQAAVSLALNNKPGVSPATRQRVFALRRSHQKKPDAGAGIEARKGVIVLLTYKRHGMIVGNTPFLVSLTETVHRYATQEAYEVNISYYTKGQPVSLLLSQLGESRVAGVILLGTEMQEDDLQLFEQVQKPMVIMDTIFPCHDVDTVTMDNVSGIQQSMRVLFDMGHRSIGFIGSAVATGNFTQRYYGYRQALDFLKLPYVPEWTYLVNPSAYEARRDVLQLLEAASSMPTAFVAGNDVIAMGAMQAFASKGYRVPEDISLIGFDDLSTSRYLTPPLSSVSLNTLGIGKRTVQRLVEKIEEPSAAKYSLQQLVGVELMKRESVLHRLRGGKNTI